MLDFVRLVDPVRQTPVAQPATPAIADIRLRAGPAQQKARRCRAQTGVNRKIVVFALDRRQRAQYFDRQARRMPWKHVPDSDFALLLKDPVRDAAADDQIDMCAGKACDQLLNAGR